jgi:ATP adenylyltransferase
MEMSSLYAPWRMQYIKSLEKSAEPSSPTGCFLCDAVHTLDDADQRRKRLVLWSTPHSIVMLNRYPYTSGHILVAPRVHYAELGQLSDAELFDLTKQTAVVIEKLKSALNPQGFNVGINLGRAAGAGLPGHLHQHIVPRWAGDTNFISVVGDIRILPQSLETMWESLASR